MFILHLTCFTDLLFVIMYKHALAVIYVIF